MIDSEAINKKTIDLLYPIVKNFEDFARSFAANRFQTASAEEGYAENEEEEKALEKIARNIQCTITSDGGNLKLDIDYLKDEGNYTEIIAEGMPAPYVGGDGGVVHNPDGSTTQSKVDPKFWGTRLDNLSKSGSDVLDEVKNLLQQAFKEHVEEMIAAHKSDIANIARPYVVQELNNAFKE